MGQNSPLVPKKSLYLMIYVKLSENLVNYSLEYSELDSILYTLDWDLGKLIQITRPWKVLGRKDDVYKPSIIPEFFEIWKFEEQPEETYNSFSPKLYTDLLDTAQILEGYGLISPKLPEIPKYDLVYNCDILNLLEDYYGPDNLQKIQNYFDLSVEESEFLKRFYKGLTKDKMLNLLHESLSTFSIDNISEFLPSWCKDSLKIFGIGSGDNNKKSVFQSPEYKSSTPLGYVDHVEIRKEMIDEIYKEFEVGAIMRGSEIRTRFREIYRKYGLNPKAGLNDFMEYFVIRKAKSEYEWYYRIIRRKKDEVLASV